MFSQLELTTIKMTGSSLPPQFSGQWSELLELIAQSSAQCRYLSWWVTQPVSSYTTRPVTGESSCLQSRETGGGISINSSVQTLLLNIGAAVWCVLYIGDASQQ